MNADPKQTHVERELKHTSPLVGCRIDPLGRYVFAGAQDSTVQRFDLESGEARPLKAHDSWVRAIAFSPEGATTVTGGYDGRLIWWETASAEPSPARTLEAHDGWIRAAAVSPDGTLLATVGDDRLVKLWNLADGTLLREMSGHEKSVYSVAFGPGGEQLVSGDLAGQVLQWQAADGKQVRKLDAGKLHSYNKGQGVDFGGVRDMALSPDGKLLACGGLINASNPLGAVHNPAVVLFDWETGKEARLQQTKGKLRGTVWNLAFHPDNFLIAGVGGSGGGNLVFFQPEATNELHTFKLPNTVRGMDLHPDGIQVATAHYDGRVRISAMRAKEK